MRLVGKRCHFAVAGLLAGLMLFGCAAAPPAEKVPAPTVARTPQTLAILPFENNSVTDPERYAPLSKGLAAMLITDLAKGNSPLTLVERQKIESLLKEIALGQSGSVDQSTAVQVGKILGAQTIAFGSFMVLGTDVRMDVRIINVETGALVVSESISGKSDGFMALEQRLAARIADALQVAFQPQASPAGSIDAALYFSKGVEALDRGDRAAARQWFDQCIAIDSGYREQVAGLEGAL